MGYNCNYNDGARYTHLGPPSTPLDPHLGVGVLKWRQVSGNGVAHNYGLLSIATLGL